MPEITVNGQKVRVGDEFMQLSPAEQDRTVDEIARSMQEGERSPWERGTLLPIERNRETGEYRGPVMPKIGEGIMDALRLPGDAFRGDVPDLDPRMGAENISQQTMNRVGNAALLMSPSTPAMRANMAVGPQNKAQARAATRLQRNLAADDVPIPQLQTYMDDMGKGALPLDLGPNVRQSAGGVASVPGAGQKVLTNALKTRAAETGSRVADDVAKAFGTGQPAAAMIDDITAAQSAAAKPLYDAVRGTPLQTTGNIKFVAETPMGKRAFTKALEMARNDGMQTDQLTVGLVDYAKRALDDISSAAARAGNNNEARQAREMAKLLVREADKMAPDYAKARAAYAGPAAVKDALEVGQSIFSKKTSPFDLQSFLKSASPSEKEAMMQGARSALEDLMSEAVNGPLAVRNALRKGAVKDKLTQLFGQGTVDDLVKAMEREMEFGESANTIMRNSVTASRQVGQMEAAPHLRRTDVPHGWFDSVLRIFDAARSKVMKKAYEQANEEYAKLVTSNKVPSWATTPPVPMSQRMTRTGGQAVISGRSAERQGNRLVSGGGGY